MFHALVLGKVVTISLQVRLTSTGVVHWCIIYTFNIYRNCDDRFAAMMQDLVLCMYEYPESIVFIVNFLAPDRYSAQVAMQKWDLSLSLIGKELMRVRSLQIPNGQVAPIRCYHNGTQIISEQSLLSWTIGQNALRTGCKALFSQQGLCRFELGPLKQI